MMKRSTLFLCLLFLCLVFNVQAQEETHKAILSTGGEATGDEGSVSYSIGQIVYTSITGANASINQGVQQAYEISVMTGIEEIGILLEILAYPNPTTDFLNLKVDKLEERQLMYQLLNINGAVIEQNLLSSDITSIPMSNYMAGVYLIIVKSDKKIIKKFKIIKK